MGSHIFFDKGYCGNQLARAGEKLPIFIFHGGMDMTVGWRLGRRVFEACAKTRGADGKLEPHPHRVQRECHFLSSTWAGHDNIFRGEGFRIDEWLVEGRAKPPSDIESNPSSRDALAWILKDVLRPGARGKAADWHPGLVEEIIRKRASQEGVYLYGNGKGEEEVDEDGREVDIQDESEREREREEDEWSD